MWKGLCCSERALLRSTVEVQPKRAICRYGRACAALRGPSYGLRWKWANFRLKRAICRCGRACTALIGPLISLCRPLSGPKMLFRRSGKDSCCIEGALCLPVRRPERVLCGPGNEAKFIFIYGVGCRKKSFMLGVKNVGKIRMVIFE